MKTTGNESKKDFCNKGSLMFVNKYYFSPSTVQNTVPKLQLFKAHTAHTAYGKYTLFSLYGMMVNGVSLGLVFGNKNKQL